jgi:hypothetical protein
MSHLYRMCSLFVLVSRMMTDSDLETREGRKGQSRDLVAPERVLEPFECPSMLLAAFREAFVRGIRVLSSYLVSYYCCSWHESRS